MTDFIAALEEQLVTAHRERRPRRFVVPWRGGAVLVAAVATVAVVVAVVVALASPDKQRATPPPAQEPPAQTTPVHPVKPTTVSVLNGTTVTGLGRAAMNTLLASGFREGGLTNDTTNQQRRLTTIYYERGFREQAQTAAGCLHVGLDRVVPMNANARVAADRADLAVFVGADKAK
ncbi:MAG: LytR cell envelope-related transcriptional attenuator [Solirubrobacteraceae bacterium]